MFYNIFFSFPSRAQRFSHFLKSLFRFTFKNFLRNTSPFLLHFANTSVQIAPFLSQMSHCTSGFAVCHSVKLSLIPYCIYQHESDIRDAGAEVWKACLSPTKIYQVSEEFLSADKRKSISWRTKPEQLTDFDGTPDRIHSYIGPTLYYPTVSANGYEAHDSFKRERGGIIPPDWGQQQS